MNLAGHQHEADLDIRTIGRGREVASGGREVEPKDGVIQLGEPDQATDGLAAGRERRREQRDRRRQPARENTVCGYMDHAVIFGFHARSEQVASFRPFFGHSQSRTTGRGFISFFATMATFGRKWSKSHFGKWLKSLIKYILDVTVVQE